MRELTYIRAIKEALAEEMRRDGKVFLLGESVRGGSYEHTSGLVQEFGTQRVLDTPYFFADRKSFFISSSAN